MWQVLCLHFTFNCICKPMKETNFQDAISKQAMRCKIILEERNMHLLLKCCSFARKSWTDSTVKLVSATCPQGWQRRSSHLQSAWISYQQFWWKASHETPCTERGVIYQATFPCRFKQNKAGQNKLYVVLLIALAKQYPTKVQFVYQWNNYNVQHGSDAGKQAEVCNPSVRPRTWKRRDAGSTACSKNHFIHL